jgi:hypothetical protein
VPSSIPPIFGTTTGVMVELPQAMTWKVAAKIPAGVPAAMAPPYVWASPSTKVQPIVGIVPDEFAPAMKPGMPEAPGKPA